MVLLGYRRSSGCLENVSAPELGSLRVVSNGTVDDGYLVQTNDGIVVCNPGENHGSHLLKFEKTGTMASQASVSAHGVGFEDLHGPSRIALHEPSQNG